jgi:hypothetical protein
MGTGLMGAPLYEEAVADAPEQTGHKHRVRVADAATIIVMGNVQTLVQAVFDAYRYQKIHPFPGVVLFRAAGLSRVTVQVAAQRISKPDKGYLLTSEPRITIQRATSDTMLIVQLTFTYKLRQPPRLNQIFRIQLPGGPLACLSSERIRVDFSSPTPGIFPKSRLSKDNTSPGRPCPGHDGSAFLIF